MRKLRLQTSSEGPRARDWFQKHMAWIALTVVVVIVGIAAVLTYKGKIDGSTFTFLLGLIVGHVLTDDFADMRDESR